ncbi:TolC family protein [Mucilaginibacter ginsenosidivorans]|nr:TolC family protein [Mucilaginibacter ginsenosidivorans]
MFFRKIALILLLLTLIVSAKAQQADSVYTLQQCIDLAIKNNLDVKKSGTQLERAKVNSRQARENLLPNLNGNIYESISNGRSQDPTTYNYVTQRITYGQYNLSTNVTLFNGMNLINIIKQNSLLYQAGKMDFQQIKDITTINITALYLQELSSEDQLNQANLQFDASKVNVDRVTALNNAGSITPTDYLNIKGTHDNDALAVVNAKNAVITAKLNLLEAMNVPFSTTVKFARLTADQLPANYDQGPDQIYSSALSNLAVVKAADLRVKAAEKEVSAAKGKYYPNISLGAGIGTNFSNTNPASFTSQFRNNYSYGPSLQVQIPILNWFQTRNNVAKAKIDLEDAKNASDGTQVQLKQQIAQAYSNMTTAYDRYHVLLQQVETYKESYRVTQAKFENGVVTADIFVLSKQNLDAANINLISARYDYITRIKILDYYQGKLSSFK